MIGCHEDVPLLELFQFTINSTRELLKHLPFFYGSGCIASKQNKKYVINVKTILTLIERESRYLEDGKK